ncbi:MAG TPA: riboflavin synthase [Solirubrobacterales bacterium]|jgi:riboflavin synthase|nr:riboflavin synthase [Solirubrobacterales bacterium]
MFTGIVTDVGTVERMDADENGARLRISTRLAGELSAGDSVSVNGACLTAAMVDGEGFVADVVNQTLELTSLGPLKPGERVNLELPVRLYDRLGGHLVQGHVDGTGEVLGSTEEGFGRRLRIRVPDELRRYLVERGSVAVDGVSLTIAALTDGAFEVALVPETLQRTTLGAAKEGRRVNLELDVIARYVERLVRFTEKET